MDPGDQLYTLDELRCWKVENLRQFLTMRGLAKSGTKEELAALCFSACKLNLPLVPSQDDILKDNKRCYDNILSECGISDPLQIYSGWLDEHDGMRFWPPIFLSDITQFLLAHGDVALTNDMLKDYKVGKAYEYFASGWLQEGYFLKTKSKNNNNLCIVRAKCSPSQRLNDDPHNVWICAKEDDGMIEGAYCSCTAGLGQTCSHIAALLFRIEAANRVGQTSCTANKCSWVMPKNVKDLEPCELSDLCTKVKKTSRAKIVKRRQLVATEKKRYQPIPAASASDVEATRNSLTIAFRGLLPNACIFKGLQAQTMQQEQHTNRLGNANPTFPQPEECSSSGLNVIQKFDISEITSRFHSATTCYDFLNFLPKITEEEILKIQNATTGQSENEIWFKLRKGRITASKFYQVYTRVNTIQKNGKENTDCTALLKSVMCYTDINPNIKSLKYGRETEPIAIDAYLFSYRKDHQNAVATKCGLFIDKNNIFLSATPDLLLSCTCCGEGLLEVKCPIIPECKTCTTFCDCKLPEYIVKINGVYNIKQNHSYYVQVQGQLAVTGRRWCDLFIYTINGPLEFRITFQEEQYRNSLLPNLKLFFIDYVIPELLTECLKKQLLVASEETHDLIDGDNYNLQARSRFFCSECNNIIKDENLSSNRENSICCDLCNLWYHFRCVKVKKSELKKYKQWSCPKCSSLV